jgi:GTPase SAR1 family protein
MVIVGNKADLESERYSHFSAYSHFFRQVTTAEAYATCKGLKIPYFEVSSKNYDLVSLAFDQIIREIRDHDVAPPPPLQINIPPSSYVSDMTCLLNDPTSYSFNLKNNEKIFCHKLLATNLSPLIKDEIKGMCFTKSLC